MTSADRAATFAVAVNPDPDSKLRFLISLPLASGALVLKAQDRCAHPRSTAIAPTPGPSTQSCSKRCRCAAVKRGRAIDLVLDRARGDRSQIVFTTIKGREGIFWQSPKTARRSRPAVRVPARRASRAKDLAIAVDTRERYPFKFTRQQATTYRRALPAGDYGVELDGEVFAVVERKSLKDLASSLVDGSVGFALAELATVPHAALVVEERYAALFKVPHVAPGFLPDLLGALQVRYAVPIVFCDTRPLAEEWTFRFLGAAMAGARHEAEGGALF